MKYKAGCFRRWASAVLVGMIFLIASRTQANNVVIDGINWVYTNYPGGIEITGIGYTAWDPPNWSTFELVIRSSLYGSPVVRLGNLACARWSKLKSVVIPSTVKGIGAEAFLECSSLVSVSIPSSVGYIEKGAFKNCSQLEKLTLPAGIGVISDSLFSGCSSLSSVNIPMNVTCLGSWAFSNCTNLPSVSIPNGVTNIGQRTFEMCCSLRSISIPNNVKEIGQYAFSGCSNLISMAIPDSVTNIGYMAFQNCSALKTLTVPGAWQGTSKLAGTSVPKECQVVYRADTNLTIAPVSRNFEVEGGSGAIVVSDADNGGGWGEWGDELLHEWHASASEDWITLHTTNGWAGNPVAYTVLATTNVLARTGYIYVNGHKFTINQAGYGASIAPTNTVCGWEGVTGTIAVNAPEQICWTAQANASWLSVTPGQGAGPGNVTYTVAPLTQIGTRKGTLTIAGNTFTVSQTAGGVEVEYDTKLFGADGGGASLAITLDAQIAWTAGTAASWITLYEGNEGTGNGLIRYIVSPYVNGEGSRTAAITVGDNVVYISQRTYDLSLDLPGATVTGRNGEGSFGVSSESGAEWQAIKTASWISFVSGFSSGSGNGVVKFRYTENNTGQIRTGKIIVAGEVYTLQQMPRQLIDISAETGHGGTVEGSGKYDLGETVELTAIPDSGYAFSHWTGSAESPDNPLVFTADVPKSFTAVFVPLPIAFESVASGTDGVMLSWNNLAWAVNYRLFRGVTSALSSAEVLAVIPNTGNCTFLDETGEVDVKYWYWIEAEGAKDDVIGDPTTGTKKWAWPDVQDEASVTAALTLAVDARLGARIGSIKEYEAFRTWGAERGFEPRAVRDSAHAWPSYVLGSSSLFNNEPTIKIDGLTPDDGTGNSRTSGTSWEVRVTVKDGENAVSVDATKVATLFEATRQIGDWTEPFQLQFSVIPKGTDGDTLLFKVSPDEKSAQSTFLRLGE